MLEAVTEAAFFDLDKTVIAHGALVAFGGPFRRAGMVNRRVLARTIWNGMVFRTFGADEERMRRFRESTLQITRGWDHATVTSIVQRTLADVIDPIVYDEAIVLIEGHRAAGRKVYLVSASPEEIVAPLAMHLGLDGLIASRARLDADGRYTGEVGFYCYGEQKVMAMRELATREGIDLSASFAYSDSATDLPMLRSVGHPIAVNPDRELTRVARAEGWPIVEFEHRVPLRERVALPTTTRARVVSTAAVIMAIGSVVAAASLIHRRTSERVAIRRPAAS
ncbi:MAG: HAD-IB family hydrolase [Acidobacteria bacterium]|nr:HAD-IB family hydrolase [Acidobacteriota bacterium]